MGDEEFTFKNLLDSKFPLLEKFRDVAPGSFRHSQNVSQLCESVAMDLELDTDMMKCAGLYHDIGKINAPEIFSENQNGKNMHDDLDPNISYHLITRHVGDTVTRLLEIPDFAGKLTLMNIVSQHHGIFTLLGVAGVSFMPEQNQKWKIIIDINVRRLRRLKRPC